MKAILVSTAAALALSGAALGLQDSQNVSVGSFDRLDVGGNFNVVFEQADNHSMRMEGDSRDFEDIEYEVDNGELEIRQDRRFFGLFGRDHNLDVTIYVTAPNVDSFSFSRGVSARASGISAQHVSISASTGSGARLEGSCTSMSASASTGASMNASGLECGDVRASASTGSDLTVFASGEFTASASTGASVNATGNPQSISMSTSTGGDVSIF